MKLRSLKTEDAEWMLEWMHDDFVVHDMRTDFSRFTIDDCLRFISSAEESDENLHLAIADNRDLYMGTVSLKHIDGKTAEFGITIRRCAMGKGYSRFAMKEILKYGLEGLHLHLIYWCVDPENQRAVRFYDKNGYQRCPAPSQAQGYSEDEKERFLWYSVNGQPE